MRKSALLLVAAVVSLAFAPAPLPRPAPNKDDRMQLQGTWERLTYTLGGQPVPLVAPNGGPIHAVFTGDHVTFTQGALTHGKWRITLDTRKSPKSFEMTWEQTGRTLWGVYELKGDTLTMCCSTNERERPTDFDGSKPGRYHSTFKRLKR
jgi:uncharacterized protein (TIGR03067 family)